MGTNMGFFGRDLRFRVRPREHSPWRTALGTRPHRLAGHERPVATGPGEWSGAETSSAESDDDENLLGFLARENRAAYTGHKDVTSLIAKRAGGRYTSPFESRLSVMRLKVVLEPSEEGGYTAYVPSLPGCISEGETKDEAVKNIKEAIELYLEPIEDDATYTPGTEVTEVAV